MNLRAHIATSFHVERESGNPAYNRNPGGTVRQLHSSAPVGPVPPPGELPLHPARGDLDLASFDHMGRLGKIFQLFGDRTDSLLTELNEVLAA